MVGDWALGTIFQISEQVPLTTPVRLRQAWHFLKGW
jgi:hypothetical protein